ncbi:MAG: FxSxx-COOH system tetratricopeptide repeat protein [Nitrospirae bacterium]|nr:FxSxx-COOH system tetratricopeptide repeat protein [Nitrospirota bacterium]
MEEAGYSVVLQAWDFHAGNNFVVEMDNATKLANATIPVLSPDYQNSLFSKAEWVAAFAQDPTGEKRKLFPVRVREVELKGLLAQIVYIDLADKEENHAREYLLTRIKEERGKPSTPPKFPATQQKTIPKPKRFPGALPPIWNVSHHRNPNFTGRVELLEKLRTTLSTSKAAAVTQAITGLGGVGKTQTAIEYAYRHSSEYEVVWWVKSEKQETLAADYAALAQELNLPEKGMTDQPAIIKAVRAWFGQNEKWLLIYDNAEDPQEIREKYLPQGGDGHVLITSRNPNWSETAHSESVSVLNEDEAVEFLLKRTGGDDLGSATILAKELGYLPLALEQAAAYIKETRITTSKYVELAEKQKVELLKQGKKPSGYEATVFTTWNLSFQKIQEEDQAASDLLKAFAFLAPDDIPLALFLGKHEDLPPSLQELGENELVLNQSLGILLKYSLVERQGDDVFLHRLVQAVLKNQMDKEEK